MPDVEEQLRRYGASLLSDLDPVDVGAVMGRRGRGPWRDRRVLVGVGVALVAALLISLAVAFDGSRSQHIETVGQPTSPTSVSVTVPVTTIVAPASEVPLPRLLLGQDGWQVTRADEGANTGEMTLERGDQEVELRWNEPNQYPYTVEDRRASSDSEWPIVVAGEEGIVFRYEESQQFTAIWRDGAHTFELVGAPFESVDEFRLTAATLGAVDEATWLAAMPASVIPRAERAAVATEMLADIPLPPGLDVDALTAAGFGISDRYQMGAEVTGAVSCAWIARWADARRTGDRGAEAEAVAAMATSHDWAILQEMDADGAWSLVLWGYADAMAGDGTADDPGSPPVDVAARSGLGCGPAGE